MKQYIRVASPPRKPILFFDGECNFCTRWIQHWRHSTADRVDYVRSQDPCVRSSFPELPDELFRHSVQLIETDGCVFSGAEAVFRSLAHGRRQWPLWFYENIPGMAALTEWFYRRVANNRGFFSFLTRLIWRSPPRQ